MDIRDRVIVALDTKSREIALNLVENLVPYVSTFKIGHELVISIDLSVAVNLVRGYGGRVFYDAKFYDIPEEVGKSALIVAELGVEMFTVHASGGSEMMRSAVQNRKKAQVIAVTVLTSFSPRRARMTFGVPMSESDGGPQPELSDDEWLKEKVRQFAHSAHNVGVNGIVCSAQEASFLRQDRFLNVLLKNMLTPGIRPSWASIDDHERIMTPYDAIRAGVGRLIIGRPITERLFQPISRVRNPVEAIKMIHAEILEAEESLKSSPRFFPADESGSQPLQFPDQ